MDGHVPFLFGNQHLKLDISCKNPSLFNRFFHIFTCLCILLFLTSYILCLLTQETMRSEVQSRKIGGSKYPSIDQ